jgi:muconolactone D-isomerase
MDFLVQIQVNLPPDTDPSRRDALVAAESARATELAEQGVIYRLWRVPGRWSNVGIWRAADATALHEAICSLPMHPWLDVMVTPLGRHPNDPGEAARRQAP